MCMWFVAAQSMFFKEVASVNLATHDVIVIKLFYYVTFFNFHVQLF